MLERASAERSRPDGEAAAIDWLARARAVAPVVAGAADRIERERELPAEVVTALHEAQLFRMLLPRWCDGGELAPAVYLEVIEEIAKQDASTAWCVGQAAGTAMAAAYLQPEAARDVFADPRAVVASGPAYGTAVAVDGGFRVTGTWLFASGSKHATWLGGHCLVHEPDGTPRRDPSGNPVERTVLFRKEHARFTDNWHVMGLNGTGSDQYAVQDLFVPQAYSYTRNAEADRREGGPLYRFAIFQMHGISFAGVALGIARATLDAFIALAKQKTPRTAAYVLRDNAVIQAQVGLSEAKLQSARTFLIHTLRELWEIAATSERFTLEQRARLRMAATYATHQARDVVDAAYHAAGATAIFRSNPFERRFRDVHTVSQQVQGHASNFEAVGQCLLGLPPASKIL
jgi:alkylation response protein AidB-like acyl-CoA dehydrogenase